MYTNKTSMIKTVTFLELKMQRMTSAMECQIPFGHMPTGWIIFPLSSHVPVETGVRK
jgi:hypothetical protein